MPGFSVQSPKPSASCSDAFIGTLNDKQLKSGPQLTTDTARSYRYYFECYMGSDINLFLMLEKCGRPTLEQDKMVIHYQTEEIYRPGKYRWAPINMVFYEQVKDRFNVIADMMYKWRSKIIDFDNSVINTVDNYYSQGMLSMTDGYDEPIWNYRLYDCWPSKITPSEMDYSASNICKMDIELSYNKAEEYK